MYTWFQDEAEVSEICKRWARDIKPTRLVRPDVGFAFRFSFGQKVFVLRLASCEIIDAIRFLSISRRHGLEGVKLLNNPRCRGMKANPVESYGQRNQLCVRIRSQLKWCELDFVEKFDQVRWNGEPQPLLEMLSADSNESPGWITRMIAGVRQQYATTERDVELLDKSLHLRTLQRCGMTSERITSLSSLYSVSSGFIMLTSFIAWNHPLTSST